MKRLALLLSLLVLVVALPALGDDERNQSFLSYDDGGTIVRSSDGREIEAHRNLPIYPGDEMITARRGRSEVRLSDGNIIGVDHTTSLRFRSILDSYEGDANETVIELKFGKVAVYRTDLGNDHVRLDTDSASYVAEYEAVYSVDTTDRGGDHITVFDGSVEIRTPTRVSRIRKGESANVDDGGPYDFVSQTPTDDFDQWFLRRVERFQDRDTKYVDDRLSYYTEDLDDYGQWVTVAGIGSAWRPTVSVGWRPFYNGYWYHSRYGCLTWVSYDPWGWGTFHYGRWAYDPGYGWIWVPGYGYSPAWVYWLYGPSYVGWAPAGWWDCYRPYYNWAYQPYRHREFGFGFYGRVRINEVDLRPWTFVDSKVLVSKRVDRAALTIDAVKARFGRSGSGDYATISGGVARFTRDEWQDPAEVIRRRGIDPRATGAETGAPPTDLTPFFRRDQNVSGTIRDRIVGGRGEVPGPTNGPITGVAPPPSPGSGSIAPIGSGGLAPIGRGPLAPIGGGNIAPVTPPAPTPSRGSEPPKASEPPNRRNGSSGDRIDRSKPPEATPPPSAGDRNDRSSNWRERKVDRPSEPPKATQPPPSTSKPPPAQRSPSESWRGRARSDESPPRSSAASGSRSNSASSGSSDIPRRVIDRIGGARVYPRDSSGSTTSRDSSSSSRNRVEPARPSRPRTDSGSRSSGSNSNRSTGSSNRSTGSSNRSTGSSNHSSSGSSGGKINRGHR